MGDRPTDETLANVSPPAALTAVLRGDHDRDRYDVGLPGIDEPVTFRLRNPYREERRQVYIDHADRCTLTAMTAAYVEFHVERLTITWHSYDGGDTHRLDSVTLSGHAIGVIHSVEIRQFHHTLKAAPEWLPGLIDFVRP